MNILLTGPNSFSGKVILELLLAKNYNVTTISRQKLTKQFSGNINCLYGDLATIDRLDGQFDTVVHIAATSPAEGIDAAHLIQDNTLATQNLIELVKNCSIKKFIFFSTCSVYGDVSQSVLSENTLINNPCSYGASKLMCEAMLREQTLFQSVAIRLPAVIGQGAARHWLANTINKIKADEDITIYNPQAIFNNAIHINKLAQFVEHLLNCVWPYHFDFMNVASSNGLPILNIIERIITKFNSTSIVNVGPAKKVPFSISSLYAEEQYSFKPLEFKEGLDRYLDEC